MKTNQFFRNEAAVSSVQKNQSVVGVLKEGGAGFFGNQGVTGASMF